MSNDKKFTIGGFSFDNYYEYRASQEDVQKIEYINKELDVRDPEVAVRLYNDLRDGVITFNSPIGQQFAEHVADIVAHNSESMLDDRQLIKEAETQAKSQRTIGLVFVSLAVLIFGVYAAVEFKDVYKTRQIAKMAEQKQATLEAMEEEQTKRGVEEYIEPTITITPIVSADDVENSQVNNEEVADIRYNGAQSMLESPWNTAYNAEDLTMLAEFTELYRQNSDLVGWLEIVDTDINYPVMQTPSDPDFYLRRDFNGADDTNGTLYVDYRCDVINSTTNTIIYGHDMKSGKMFGGLKRYLDKDFLEKHKNITFTTIYEEREYEIVAVGLSKVGYNDDDSYKYYDFIDAADEKEYKEFIDNISSLKVSEKNVDISMTDKVLTLSTCNSYTEDGRLFVVAKRIK